jgi:hypothetical protein
LHLDTEPAAPGSELQLLAGNIGIATTSDELTVFELSNTNRLRFRVLDTDLLLVSIKLVDLKGREMLRVVDNHVRTQKDSRIKCEFRRGRVLVSVPANASYVPQHLIDRMREHVPAYASDGRVIMLDLEVIMPGTVKTHGCWYAPEGSIVMTERGISFARADGPLTTLTGPNKGIATLKMLGGSSISKTMFGFTPKASPTLQL